MNKRVHTTNYILLLGFVCGLLLCAVQLTSSFWTSCTMATPAVHGHGASRKSTNHANHRKPYVKLLNFGHQLFRTQTAPDGTRTLFMTQIRRKPVCHLIIRYANRKQTGRKLDANRHDCGGLRVL
jgi:hypothetical protein